MTWTPEQTRETGRIWFKGNPWPEGHAIKEFSWTLEEKDGDVWFLIELKSANYYAESRPEEEDDYDSDWLAPSVWANFHSCRISDNLGIRVCPAKEYSLQTLDGLVLRADILPGAEDLEWDDHAFHTYLLGHDSVADHKLTFTRLGESDRFDIEWTGRIALTYVGDEIYRHSFRAVIHGVGAPALS